MKKYYILIVLLFCSCADKPAYDTFTREWGEISTPKREILYDYNEREDDYNLETIIVYNDSIRIKEYENNPRSKYFLEFENINDTSQTKGYITYGKGHMEMKGATLQFNDN